MSKVLSIGDKSPLRALDVEEIEHFLMCHPKYLCNPLTDKERALLRDVVTLTAPFTRRRAKFPCTYIE
jgi:hypothetical protein